MDQVVKLKVLAQRKRNTFLENREAKRAVRELSRESLHSNLYEALHPGVPIEILRVAIKEIKSALKFPWEEMFLSYNGRDEDGFLPLHKAISENCSFEAVKTILFVAPEAVFIPDLRNNLPLHISVAQAYANPGALEIISLLIEAYKEQDKEEYAGGCQYRGEGERLPLHTAVNAPRLDMLAPEPVVLKLLATFPEGAQYICGQGFLPLHLAARNAAPYNLLRALIDAYPMGCIQRSEDGRGELPLHLALGLHKTDINCIELLLGVHDNCSEQFFDSHSRSAMTKLDTVGVKNNLGQLPVHCACSNAHLSVAVILLLISKNAMSLKAVDKRGRVPLHCAAEALLSADIVAILLEKCPETAAIKDYKGNLPLHVAVEYNCPLETIAVIINANRGAVSERNGSRSFKQDLPIHLALKSNSTSIDVLQLLLCECPESMEECTRKQRLPIHCAAANAQTTIEILRFVIDAFPAGVCTEDEDGQLPVHLCVSNPKVPVHIVQFMAAEHGSSSDTSIRSLLASDDSTSLRSRSSKSLAILNILDSGEQLKKLGNSLINYISSNGGSQGSSTPNTPKNAPASPPPPAAAAAVVSTRIRLDSVGSGSGDGLKVDVTYNNNTNNNNNNTNNNNNNKNNVLAKPNKAGMLPIHCAAQCNPSAKVMNVLICKYKAGLKCKSIDNKLPLHYAVENHVPVDESECEAREELERQISSKRKTTLLDPLTYLSILENSDDMSEQRKEHPLSHASEEVVFALVDAYPKAAREPDILGNLPLHIAVQHNTSVKIISWLLNAYCGGAQICNEETYEFTEGGNVPIQVALEAGAKLSEDAIIELLDAYPECVRLTNKSGIVVHDTLRFLYKHTIFDNWCAKHPVNVIDYLSLCERPVVVLHRVMPWLTRYFRSLFAQQSISVLFILTKFIISLRNACGTHSADSYYISKNVLPVFEQLLVSVFDCPSMDNPDNVVTLLLNRDCKISDHHGKAHRYHETLNSGLLAICIKHDIKVLFPCTQISNIIEDISYKHLGEPYFVFPHPWHISTICDRNKVPKVLSSGVLQRIGLLTMNLRSCPVAMLLLEGLAKLFTLFVMRLTLFCSFSDSENSRANTQECYRTKGVLVLMLVTFILYEVGQLAEGDWVLSHHFSNMWNRFDACGIALLLLWALTQLRDKESMAGRACISLAAIPLCLSLLKYLSLKKSLGILVVSVGEMFYDMFNFLVILVIISFGFALTIYGLFFSDNNSTAALVNASSFDIIGILLTNSLGEIDFSHFDGSPFKSIGVLVLGVYVAVTAIILLNLVIAVMSTTYERVSQFSIEEWSAVKSASARSFMLVQERHPLCMLPPPLNVIPTLLYPLHVYAYSDSNSGAIIPKNVSIAGTVSNVILAYIGAIPRIIALILHHIPGTHRGILSMILLGTPRLILLILHTVFVAPLRGRSVVVHLVDQEKKQSILPFIDYRYWKEMERREDENNKINKIDAGVSGGEPDVDHIRDRSTLLERKGSRKITKFSGDDINSSDDSDEEDDQDKIIYLGEGGKNDTKYYFGRSIEGSRRYNAPSLSSVSELNPTKTNTEDKKFGRKISNVLMATNSTVADGGAGASSNLANSDKKRYASAQTGGTGTGFSSNISQFGSFIFGSTSSNTPENGDTADDALASLSMKQQKTSKTLHPGRSLHSLTSKLKMPVRAHKVPILTHRQLFTEVEIDRLITPMVEKLHTGNDDDKSALGKKVSDLTAHIDDKHQQLTSQVKGLEYCLKQVLVELQLLKSLSANSGGGSGGSSGSGSGSGDAAAAGGGGGGAGEAAPIPLRIIIPNNRQSGGDSSEDVGKDDDTAGDIAIANQSISFMRNEPSSTSPTSTPVIASSFHAGALREEEEMGASFRTESADSSASSVFQVHDESASDTFLIGANDDGRNSEDAIDAAAAVPLPVAPTAE